MPSKLTLNRRLFLKGVTGGTAGIMAGCWINLAPAGAMITGASMELSESFLNPPTDARPWVYWFWINGNITKEGITADLEDRRCPDHGGGWFPAGASCFWYIHLAGDVSFRLSGGSPPWPRNQYERRCWLDGKRRTLEYPGKFDATGSLFRTFGGRSTTI